MSNLRHQRRWMWPVLLVTLHQSAAAVFHDRKMGGQPWAVVIAEVRRLWQQGCWPQQIGLPTWHDGCGACSDIKTGSRHAAGLRALPLHPAGPPTSSIYLLSTFFALRVQRARRCPSPVYLTQLYLIALCCSGKIDIWKQNLLLQGALNNLGIVPCASDALNICAVLRLRTQMHSCVLEWQRFSEGLADPRGQSEDSLGDTLDPKPAHGTERLPWLHPSLWGCVAKGHQSRSREGGRFQASSRTDWWPFISRSHNRFSEKEKGGCSLILNRGLNPDLHIGSSE